MSSPSDLEAALDVAIDRMTREHAGHDVFAAVLHQIITDHRERP